RRASAILHASTEWSAPASHSSLSGRSMPADSPWLAFPAPNPRAKLRLLCFPYAGGGPTIFHGWPSRLPGAVEVCSIYLPGRGARLADAPFTRPFPLGQALVQAPAPHLTT